MIYEYKKLTKELFSDLKDYSNYFKKNNLNLTLKLKSQIKNLSFKKYNPDAYDFKLKYNKIELEPELDDLCRLHYLIQKRKITTILEFGVGKSTIIFDDALEKNRSNLNSKIKKNSMIRRSNKFECHTIDDQIKWIDNIKKKFQTKNIIFHKSNVKMTTFNGKKCTMYNKLPTISPDFIYLDGPARFSAKGFERGWTTNFSDGMPMAADILTIEHFLNPGTLIVVDGRTANARFLKTNFQRNWLYCHDENFDQHFFELSERPLGIYNYKYLKFSLGKEYFTRLNKKKSYKIFYE
tara:strand:- start:9 stop:890 length:882 start_codon:yes stop_codon:yes gene_type:complete